MTAPKKPRPTREERHLRRHLRDLTTSVMNGLAMLDAVMECKGLSEHKRFKLAAQIATRLDVANDLARLALGVSPRGLKKKPKIEATPAHVEQIAENFERHPLSSWLR